MQDSSTYPLQRTFSTPPSEFKPPDPPALGPDAEADLWEYWDVIRRHIKLIASLFLIAELLTLLLVLVMTPLYTGVSTILIESQAPQVLQSNSNNDRSDREEIASFYRTQYEILKSRTLAAMVIRDLALDHNSYFTKKPSLARRLLSWPRSLFSSKLRIRVADLQRADILGIKAEMIDKYLAGLTIRPEYDTRLVRGRLHQPRPRIRRQNYQYPCPGLHPGWLRTPQSQQRGGPALSRR